MTAEVQKNPVSYDEFGLKYDDKVTVEERYAGDNGCQAGDAWPFWLRWFFGLFATANFVVFWGIPIFSQGNLWRFVLAPYLSPIYNWIDTHPGLRRFAETYIYNRPRHADYFAQSILCTIGFIIPFAYILYQQMTYNTLTWLQIYGYYFCWVGIRGGVLGGVYSLAHREGHNSTFYKPWVYKYIGNPFENVLGPFFGSVPYNFSTAHIYLHHALQARSGDSFYQFDVDRTSWFDFMILLHRISLHCSGFTAYNQMRIRGLYDQCAKLMKGLVLYYIVYPVVLFSLTKSWSFLFFIYVQPFIGFAFFLTFMNISFHAFVDYDEEGNPVDCVTSTDMIGGQDDYFGENSHLSHHNATHVYWRDIDENRKTMEKELAKYHGAIFRDLSIVEIAGLMLFKQYDVLAKHFVQYNTEPAKDKLPTEELIRRGRENLSNTTKQSVWVGQGKLTHEELVVMIESRLKRREPKWLRV